MEVELRQPSCSASFTNKVYFSDYGILYSHQCFGIWNNIKSALTSWENLPWSSPIEQKRLTSKLDQFSGQHFMFGAGSVTAGDYQNFVKYYIKFKVEVREDLN